MTHVIDIDLAEKYSFVHQMAGSFGRKNNKELTAVVSNGAVRYEVLSHRKCILSTVNLREAVEAYNNEA